ncbi:hypothetical protein E2542_SST29645 [Spatholobus suberectus]|nr:hypothetical protein E2542_SST29645 [Spatholobus suberectus]
MGNTMDADDYLGPQPGNVDSLVHFTEKSNEPNKNVDLDKFGIFDTHDVVNELVEDNGLAPCYPFALGFLSNLNEHVNDMQNVLVNAHVNIDVNTLVNGDVNPHMNENVTENVNACGAKTMNETGGVMDGNGEVVGSEGGVERNDGDMQDPNICPNEMYMSNDDVTYNGVDSGNVNFDSDFDSIGECEDEDWDDENDVMSDFEEMANVIGNEHSDDDMVEIYIKKGNSGKLFEKERDGESNFELVNFLLM